MLVEQTWDKSVSMIAGQPEWILGFANQLRSRVDAGAQGLANLAGLWPKLECMIHCGASLEPFAGRLRRALGPAVRFHEILASVEGVIATQDSDGQAGLRLLAGTGIFMEFIPLAAWDPLRPGASAEAALPLEATTTDCDYVVVLTTPAGLVRNVSGDVVRFISTEPHRLVWRGRSFMYLNSAGERVLDADITDSLVTVCADHDWAIVNYHVAPSRSRAASQGSAGSATSGGSSCRPARSRHRPVPCLAWSSMPSSRSAIRFTGRAVSPARLSPPSCVW
jgi:hypothetical protein